MWTRIRHRYVPYFPPSWNKRKTLVPIRIETMFLKVLALASLVSAETGESSKDTIGVRGVSPGNATFYIPDEDGMFACLAYPDIKISFDRVNDNYCDCPDGSDEPGTSACSNGYFYCAGSGNFLPSRYVDDGVCDYDLCCDGSDEPAGECENRCAEYEQEKENERHKFLQHLDKGRQIRHSYIHEAALRKEALRNKTTELEKEYNELTTKLKNLKVDYARIREEDSDSTADADSLQALGALRKTMNTAQKQYKKLYKELVDALDSYNKINLAMKKMVEEYNPNFNDPAVKECIKEWISIPKLPAVIDYQPFTYDENLFSKIKIMSYDTQQLSQASWFEQLQSMVSEFLGAWVPVSESSQIKNVGSVRAQAVKDVIDDSVIELKEMKKELAIAKKSLKLDSDFWGPDEVGRALEDICLTTTTSEGNDIEVCLFGQARMGNSNSVVSLGTSRGIREEKGHIVIDFVSGDPCVYGISRTLKVVFECGDVHQLNSISEVDACVYVINGTSPLGCAPVAAHELPGSDIHDEL